MMLLRRAALAVALAVAAGCGGDDTAQPPVETLLYVSGGPNISFSLPMNDPDCPQTGSGIQAPNASHQFGERVFQTPHLFVLENIQQPVQAVIKNLGDQPIRADLYLGTNPQVTNFVIDRAGMPESCRRIAVTSLPPPIPNPQGAQAQVEVCAPVPPTGGVDLNSSCISADPLPDANISFFSTLGDIAVSHITNCTLTPILDACRTPATLFLEQPKDEVDAIMSVNPGQLNGVVRLELYVNGTLVGVSGGNNPVVSETL